MKSRMAITAMLVLGLLLSTAGAGLATSGLGGTGSDAATAQYPTERPQVTTTTATPQGAPAVQQQQQVLQPEAAPQPVATPAPETPRVLDEQQEEVAPIPAPAPAAEEPEAQPAAQAQPAQAPRQVVAAQTGDELPFTGFAAIPVLLAGLVLLATGATLRRRTRSQD